MIEDSEVYTLLIGFRELAEERDDAPIMAAYIGMALAFRQTLALEKIGTQLEEVNKTLRWLPRDPKHKVV